jgi:hypothetical protein
MQTTDSARGLIMNMSDVLFDFGKATLRPAAREKLAKVSGILLAYPSLKVRVEGNTDNVGSDEFNQTLSEKRAEAVRDYLVSQNVSPDSLTSIGYGKTRPIASNDTADGRQQNRRVEMVMSGDIIGTPVNPGPTALAAPALQRGLRGRVWSSARVVSGNFALCHPHGAGQLSREGASGATDAIAGPRLPAPHRASAGGQGTA